MNEIAQILFRIEVHAGNLPDVAVDAAINLKATSVILDRSVQLFQTFFFPIFLKS